MKWSYSKNLIASSFLEYPDINFTGALYSKEEIKNKNISFDTFREVEFQNCKFDSVTFSNIFLGKIRFINCEFNKVSFLESNLNKVVFQNSKFTSLSIFETKLENVFFTECKIQYSKIENTLIDNSLFENIILIENIERHNKYKKVDFKRCEFNLEQIIDTKYLECDLLSSHFKNVEVDINDFISSKLSVLAMIEILSDKGILLED